MALNLDQPLLTGTGGPRVLSIPMLMTLLSRDGRFPSRTALFNWIRHREQDGTLAKISRGVYLNLLASPAVLPEEAADFIRANAVVSLQKVLGDCGFLNNFTTIITAVVPWSPGIHPRTGRFKREGAEFWFRSIPLNVYLAGEEDDRLVPCIPYRKATPERALLDWLYIATSGKSGMSAPPLDVDLEALNARRLRRLAKAMNLVPELQKYLSHCQTYAEDPEVMANGPVLPFTQ